MSEHRKKSRAASRVDHRHSTSQEVARPHSRSRQIIWQLASLLAASVVLGFAFNSSSPVGIRFNDATSDSLSSSELKTEPVPVARTNQLAMLTPTPPSSAENPRVRQIITPPPPLTSAPTRLLTPATPVAPPITPPVTAPAVAVAPPTTGVAQNPAVIHWVEAKPLAASGQAVLVDVRHKSMYDAGHIPGAISLPETSTPEEFTAFLNQYPTNLTLIVYCSSTSCSQSARVAGRLVTQYQRPSVKYMTGGYMEYQQAELANQPAQPQP